MPDETPIFIAKGHYGEMFIKQDPDYPQLWVTTSYSSGATGPSVILSEMSALQLRDSLDNWLNRQGR